MQQDRDTRFKDILRSQLGENGITLTVNLTFLFMLSLVVLIITMMALHVAQKHPTVGTSAPVLVMPSAVK